MENNEKENEDCMMNGIEVINNNPPPPEKRPCILFSGIYGKEEKEEAKVRSDSLNYCTPSIIKLHFRPY
jgi:hypothetical protein